MKKKENIVPVAEGKNLELSLKEKERRWSLLRERMKRENLAAIIFYGDSKRDGPLRYLTNVCPSGAAQHILLFPVTGEPIFLISLTIDQFFAQKRSWVALENIYVSLNLSAELAKHLLSLKLQKSRVGLDSFLYLPTRSYLELRELCPEIELVEAARLLNEIRAPKSDEELKFIQEAVRIGELSLRTFLANLKPGLREVEIAAKVESVMRTNGVDDGKMFMMSSSWEHGYPYYPGETIIQKPNPVLFNSEFTMTKGYGFQAVRTFCWEEPKDEFKKILEVCGEVREMIPKLLRPGHKVTELGAKIEELVNKRGFECDYFGHGIGLKRAEFPYITAGSHMPRYADWTIMVNEVYGMHPMIMAKGAKPPLAWVGDMYLVGEDRTTWMTPFLPGLPEMIG